MDIKEIKELLKAFDESSSSFLKIKQSDINIEIRKPEDTKQILMAPPAGQPAPMPMPMPATMPAPVPAQAPVAPATEPSEVAVSQEQGDLVLAPLVGVFYASPSPEEAPYVKVGDAVKAGQVICLIEAMKMMSEITAPRDGVIKEIYVSNQDVVGFEEKLFLIGD